MFLLCHSREGWNLYKIIDQPSWSHALRPRRLKNIHNFKNQNERKYIMAKLSNDEITAALNKLNGWKYEDNSISKEYELKDFTAALGFVMQAGVLAEKADHHPDILIYSWNKVQITLTTHDEGGVTEKDVSLAGKINELF